MSNWMTKERDRQRQLCATGEVQTIGRPAGPKAKGHKTPATGTLPYMRHSVGDRIGQGITPNNKSRQKHLAKIRKAKAAKNSVAI